MSHVIRVLLGFALLGAALPAAATVWYVDGSNTSGTEDGTSWSTAFRTISAAVAAARTYTDDEIWVAAGTYAEAGDAYTGALVLKSNVDLYGGFSGTETALSQRDWDAYETIIDGATSRNGSPAFHVVVVDNMAIDGFTITGGVADGAGFEGSGGGLIAYGAYARVRHCKFTNNQSRTGGAVMAQGSSVLTVEDCDFYGNSSYGGGAVCAFFETAKKSAIGDFAKPDVAILTLTDCSFSNNQGIYFGGAVAAEGPVQLYITRCAFDGNTSGLGGALNLSGAKAQVIDCSFTNNSVTPTLPAATARGGAVASTDGTLTLRRCAFTANAASEGGAAYLSGNTTAITTCTFLNNTASTGAGIYDALATAKSAAALPITNSLFAKNIAQSDGGALYSEGSVGLTHCTIADNGTDTTSGVVADGINSLNTILWDSYDGTLKATYSEIPGIARTNGNWDLDPQFTDAANDDYSIVSRSPAKNQATPVLVLDASLSGVWRPSGDAADIGAFELQVEPDTDHDGISDGLEGAFNSDADAYPDYLDLDSDNDGIPDAVEGPIDPDHDGLGDYRDLDSDADGLTDAQEVASRLNPNDPADASVNPEDPQEVTDPDGDGVMSAIEISMWGTNATDPDTDHDGMPDGFEVDHATGPLTPSAGNDEDGDGLPNAYEYRIESYPDNAADPPNDLYVGPSGNDAGAGTASDPLATLARVMTVAQLYSAAELYGLGTSPVTIHAATGTYTEPLVFAPDVHFEGAGTANTKIVYTGSVGNHVLVQAAAATSMYNCTVSLSDQTQFEAYLVRLDDVDMVLDNVVIDGKNSPSAIGVYAVGAGTNGSRLRDSTVRNVKQGLHTLNSGIYVARTTFSNISGDAVFVERDSAKQSGVNVPFLGDIGTPDTKDNVFRNVAGYLISNQSYILVEAERCDWGIYHKADIKRKMLGPVDFEPFQSPSGELVGCSGGTAAGLPWGDVLVAIAMVMALAAFRRNHRHAEH